MKQNKILKYISLLLIFIFICTYLIEISGYYEYNLHNKKSLTEGQMKAFEEDVKSGKEIDLNTYLKETTIDYSNKLTRTTSEASIKVNDYLKIFLTNGLKILSKLVN